MLPAGHVSHWAAAVSPLLAENMPGPQLRGSSMRVTRWYTPNDWRASMIVFWLTMTLLTCPVNILAYVPSAMLYSHVPARFVNRAKFPSGVNVHLLSDEMADVTTLHVRVLTWNLRKPNAADAFPARNTKSG
jgi:hypothetical protein